MILLPDPQATREYGRSLAATLDAGSVVALTGDLGAGKTHLVQGIAEGFGSHATVTSPTFTLVHDYGDGRLPLYHFDFYRLESIAEVLALGWEEYLESEGVCAVEWADKFPMLIPSSARWLRLEHDPAGGRRLIDDNSARPS